MADVIYSTMSICPECHQRISADYIEESGQVFMIKECKDHGAYKDLVSINAKHFRWIQQYKMDSEAKMCTPQTQANKGCPLDCGICDFHKSAPAIAIVDITYRCNLKCPICYAAAVNERGKNIEPSIEDLYKIYKHFREIKPTPPVCAMYAGGEPTVRDDFPEILAMTRDLGYIQRQVASNGIRFAKDKNYLQKCIDAGMNAIYLQFDGVGDDIYMKTRNAKLWNLKQKVIENCRELDFPNVCLVPTIAKGVNDHQVGDIIQFAIDNIDIISVISFQPVSLCGRVSDEERMNLRITSSHVMKRVNEYTGGETGWMYPMVALDKFAKVGAWMSGVSEELELTCHPNCGFGTFLFVDPKTKKFRDVTKLFHVPQFLKVSDKWYNRMLAKRQGTKKKYREVFNFGLISRAIGGLMDLAEDGIDKARFAAEILSTLRVQLDDVGQFTQRAQLVINTMLNSSRDSSANWLTKGNNLLVAMMHFQDGYNMDLERASRCLVHYGYVDPKTQTVKAVPFCPMNTIHRERIENELLMAQAVSKDEKEELPVPEIFTGN